MQMKELYQESRRKDWFLVFDTHLVSQSILYPRKPKDGKYIGGFQVAHSFKEHFQRPTAEANAEIIIQDHCRVCVHLFLLGKEKESNKNKGCFCPILVKTLAKECYLTSRSSATLPIMSAQGHTAAGLIQHIVICWAVHLYFLIQKTCSILYPNSYEKEEHSAHNKSWK